MPDCGNAKEETEKDAEVEKSYIELLTNGTAEMNVAQILHGTAEEYLSQESWKCALIIENQLRFKGLRV